MCRRCEDLPARGVSGSPDTSAAAAIHAAPHFAQQASLRSAHERQEEQAQAHGVQQRPIDLAWI